MTILYIGGGFVGACSAAVSADSGHTTIVFDIDAAKMAALGSTDRETIESCIYEEGLADLLIRNKERLMFTSDYSQIIPFLDTVDVIMMCLPTPEIGETGESNLSYYTQALTTLATYLAKRNHGAQSSYVVIVNKSTVPIHTVDITTQLLDAQGVTNYGVVSNPEFLVEGKAIEGSIHPDRVVVGATSSQDFEIMRLMYERFYTSATITYLEVTPQEAAAGKLLSNFYLFSKLAVCFDVIGRVCETYDHIAFERIRDIMTTDKRIGSWGFYNSLYAGGSCLIKDARSLSYQLTHAGVSPDLVNQTYLANKRQLTSFIQRPETQPSFTWEGKTVALLGLAFKQDTNDIRNSPSIDIAHYVIQKKATLVAYDPVAMPEFETHMKDMPITYASHAVDAMRHADIIIIATDWPQFRPLAQELLTKETKQTIIMDGRRLWHPYYERLIEDGHTVYAVGSPSFISS